MSPCSQVQRIHPWDAAAHPSPRASHNSWGTRDFRDNLYQEALSDSSFRSLFPPPASQAIGLEHLAAVRLGIAAHLLADRFLQSAVLSRPALAQLYRPISRGWHGFPKTTLG